MWKKQLAFLAVIIFISILMLDYFQPHPPSHSPIPPEPYPPVAPLPPPPPEQLTQNELDGFPAYPQRGGNTCGPVATLNSLAYLTGTVHDESKLMKEVVEADHEGLAFLEEDLRRAGIRNPRTLSRYGTTPVGITKVLDKYTPNHQAEYKEIPAFEDRLALIRASIDQKLPVIVPLVGRSLNHWGVIIGYDMSAENFLIVNAGIGDADGRPEGGTYNVVSFKQFDSYNSFENPPSGRLGKIYEIANKHGMGRWVLVFLKSNY